MVEITSLSWAFRQANAQAGPDTIAFAGLATPASIVIADALPTLTDDVAIQGPGANQLIVKQTNPSRGTFAVAANTHVEISGLEMNLGNAPRRGAVNNAGLLILSNCNLSLGRTCPSGGRLSVAQAAGRPNPPSGRQRQSTNGLVSVANRA